MEAALEKFLASNSLGSFLLDEETKRLQEEVQEIRIRTKQAKDQSVSLAEEVKAGNENLALMRNVLTHVQSLHGTYREQIVSEKDGESSAAKEEAALQQHCLHLHQQLLQVHEDTERLQQLHHERQRQAQKLREEIAGDRELLEGLLDQLSKQDQDDLMLLRYEAEDNSELKEALVFLERKSGEVAAAEASLEALRHQEAAECTAQAVLAAAYVAACSRRDQLLLHYEQGLVHLQEKGTEQAACLQACSNLQKRIRVEQQSKREEEDLLRQVKQACAQLDGQLQKDLNTSTELFLQLLESERTKTEIAAQVVGLKTGIKKAGQEVTQLHNEIAEDQEVNKQRQLQIQALEAELEKYEQRSELNSELLENTRATVKDLEALIEVNTRQLSVLTKQRERACQQQQQYETTVQRLKEEEKHLSGEIDALKTHIARTNRDTKTVAGNIARLKELCYAQECELQTLKKRIHDLTHDDNNNEDTKAQQQQLTTLLESLELNIRAVKMLQRHLVSQQSQVAVVTVRVYKQQEALQQLMQELVAARMTCYSTDRECSRLTEQRETAEVQRSVQRLQLQQRSALLHSTRAAAQELESSRVHMDQLVGEQCRAVQAQLVQLDTEQRRVDTQLHGASLKLHSDTAKLAQLKERYATLSSALGAEKEDEETEVTAARALMKLDEEMSGLQQAGDLVEEAVREAEQDLDALSVLLQHARVEGREMRDLLHNTISKGIEDEPRQKLEAEATELEKQIKYWQGENDTFLKTLNSAKVHKHEVETQVRAVEELLLEKNVHLASMDRELADQKIKISHANEAITSLLRKTRQDADLHADVELRVTQERLRLVNHHLGRLASEQPDVAPAIVLYCQLANIPPPKLSAVTHRAAYGSGSSVCSLASSRSSEDGADAPADDIVPSARSQRSSDSGNSDGGGSIKAVRVSSASRERTGATRRHPMNQKRGETEANKTKPSRTELKKNIPVEEEGKPALTIIDAAFPQVQKNTAAFKGRQFIQRPSGHQ